MKIKSVRVRERERECVCVCVCVKYIGQCLAHSDGPIDLFIFKLKEMLRKKHSNLIGVHALLFYIISHLYTNFRKDNQGLLMYKF